MRLRGITFYLYSGFNPELSASETILIPLIPISVQSSLVIGVNIINNTPNLWLTVLPSIFFLSFYGYIYTFTLLKNKV